MSGNLRLNLVFDGNSLLCGWGAGEPECSTFSFLSLKQSLPRFASIESSNYAIGGKHWRYMSGVEGGEADSVDNAWIVDALNILVCWETTNSIFNMRRTAEEVVSDAVYYVDQRLARQPWQVLVLASIPRQVPEDSHLTKYLNEEMVKCDMLMRDQFSNDTRVDFVEMRRLLPQFDIRDFTGSAFKSNDEFWFEPAGSRVHLSSFGYKAAHDAFWAYLQGILTRFSI